MANLLESFNMPNWLIAAYTASEVQFRDEVGLSRTQEVQLRDPAQKHMTPSQEQNTVRQYEIKVNEKRLEEFKQKYNVDATFLFNSYLYRLLNGMPVQENHKKEITLPRKVRLGSENIIEVKRGSNAWDAATSESLQGQSTYKRNGGQTNVKEERQIQKYKQAVVVPNDTTGIRLEHRRNGAITPLTLDIDYTYEIESKPTGEGHEKKKIWFYINAQSLKNKGLRFSTRNPLIVCCTNTAVTNMHEARRNNFSNTMFFINRATENTEIKVDVRYWDSHVDSNGNLDPILHIMNNDISGNYTYKLADGTTITDRKKLVGDTGMHSNFEIQDICMIQFGDDMILPENLQEDVELNEAEVYNYSDEASKLLSDNYSYAASMYDTALKYIDAIKVLIRHPDKYSDANKLTDQFNNITDELRSINLKLKQGLKERDTINLMNLTHSISSLQWDAKNLYRKLKSSKTQEISWDEEIINKVLNS